MSIVDRWLLPDGVEDVLPPEARKLEEVRRAACLSSVTVDIAASTSSEFSKRP